MPNPCRHFQPEPGREKSNLGVCRESTLRPVGVDCGGDIERCLLTERAKRRERYHPYAAGWGFAEADHAR